MGTRTVLESDVWLKVEADSASIRLGNAVFLGRGCELDCTESITIGDRTLLAPGVFITDHQHNIEGRVPIVEQGCTSKPVSIGRDVWVGANAVILPGVTIADGAVIGAGAVVTKDVPLLEVWAGVPARFIRRRDERLPDSTADGPFPEII